ncbi:MAG: hypothetical protein WC770_05875 [Phycisphaerae bacterium]|jgi:hypothetical protein
MDKKLKLLSGFCTAVASIGWILIIGGWFWLMVFSTHANTGVSSDADCMKFAFYGISAVSFEFFFVGIGAIIIAGLVKFIIKKESKPSLMLRCGDKLFYIFAVLGILWAVIQHSFFAVAIDDKIARFLYEQPILLPTLGKAIILILLGQILKRLLPIIEEYKSLV